MRLVDQEVEYALTRWVIVDRAPSTKDVFHQYEFSDHNDATRMGRGPTRLLAQGLADSELLESLEAATVRGTLFTLYFPSRRGVEEDDRYYQRVLTMPVKSRLVRADLHQCSIEMHALDGYAYDADTGQRVG